MAEPNAGERAGSLAREALEIHRTFVQRGLEHEKDVMADLIRRYNDMLLALEADFDDFHYVPIVGTLSSDATDYKDDWRDELHPTDNGFGQVAELFHRAITGI